MGILRNLALFLLIAFVATACGGGGAALSNSGGSGGNGAGGSGPITYGSTTLHWSAPTTRIDNTAASLSSIQSYRLYFGPSANYTPNFINIKGGTTTQYKVTLPSGSYYFRISAIDTDGYEGMRSAALQKTL